MCTHLPDAPSDAPSSSEATSGAPVSGGGCSCLLQTTSVALMIAIGLLLPTSLTWVVERHAKERYLRARGRRLLLRAAPLARLDGWLRARGLRPNWGGAMVRPMAVGVGALAVWLLSDLVVYARSAQCRAR